MRMAEKPQRIKLHWEYAVRGKRYLGKAWGGGCWQGMELGMDSEGNWEMM